jgi:hypothetical protein
MTLSSQDHWLLSRVINGFNLPSIAPDGSTPDGNKLALMLDQIGYKDREILLRRQVSPSVMKAILAIDPDSSPPRPNSEERKHLLMCADDLHSLPPVTWLIPGEIMERGMGVLYGESGVGKSFIALDYAMRIAAAGITVVYAPTEGEAGYRNRVEAWKAFHKIALLPRLYFLFGGVAIHNEKEREALMPDLKLLTPRLLVVDTLAMGMVGLDENSARDMGLFMDSCRKVMRELECAILLVHHTGKAGVAERGSSALRGNADTMIRLSNADDLILMECSKTKDEAPFDPRYIRLIQSGSSLIPIPADKTVDPLGALTPNQRRLLDVLALEVNLEGVSLRDLEGLTGMTLGTVGRAASNLVKKKFIDKSPYRINAAGLKAIGRESVDPLTESGSKTQKPARESVDPSESRKNENHRAIQNGSGDSRDSADSDGSTDSALLPGFNTVPRKRNDQYSQGA